MRDTEFVYQRYVKLNRSFPFVIFILLISIPIMFILAEVSLNLSLVYLILLNFILIIYAIYLVIFMTPLLIKGFGWEDIILRAVTR